MIEIRPAKAADAEPLAALHASSLPTSLLTVLGTSAVVRYYTFIALSSKEHGWVAQDGAAVVGGCVLSDEPHTLLTRFAKSAPVQLARELAGQALRDGGLRRRLVKRFREPSSGATHAPEVTQVFTDARLRGHGIGARLLRTCEATLRTRGVHSYFVHTQRDDNDAGIRFYLREGFVTTGESRSFGEAFLVMKKDLD